MAVALFEMVGEKHLSCECGHAGARVSETFVTFALRARPGDAVKHRLTTANIVNIRRGCRYRA